MALQVTTYIRCSTRCAIARKQCKCFDDCCGNNGCRKAATCNINMRQCNYVRHFYFKRSFGDIIVHFKIRSRPIARFSAIISVICHLESNKYRVQQTMQLVAATYPDEFQASCIMLVYLRDNRYIVFRL